MSSDMGYWRVEQVTEKPGLVMAELRAVEWFKTNPEYTALLDEVGADMPDEFIDAQPGDEGAEFIEASGWLKVDITSGPEMHPGDDVLLTFQVVVPVDA